jgi:hypothetical protein
MINSKYDRTFVLLHRLQHHQEMIKEITEELKEINLLQKPKT